MKICIFTDTNMFTDNDGSYMPVRDQFPMFILPLANHVAELFLCSRCNTRSATSNSTGKLDFPSNSTLVPLPFYEDTEDFYRKIFSVWSPTRRIIREIIAISDVVILRINHTFAHFIFRETKRNQIPLVAYWAGPALMQSVRINYPGNSPKSLAARSLAFLKTRSYRLIARNADHNLFIDQSEFEEMGMPSNTSWVVPNLVTSDDLTSNSDSLKSEEQFVIVFVGRVYRHKGVFDLLSAFRECLDRGRNAVLRIAGDGPDKLEMEKKAEATFMPGEVEFLGTLNHRQVLDELRRSHCFCLPSYAEGMPKAIWEAWASGAAVVTTPVGSVSRFVEDGLNGRLVRPGDSETLADAIDSLIENDELRRLLVSGGLATVSKHSWASEIRGISNVVHQISRAGPALDTHK